MHKPYIRPKVRDLDSLNRLSRTVELEAYAQNIGCEIKIQKTCEPAISWKWW